MRRLIAVLVFVLVPASELHASSLLGNLVITPDLSNPFLDYDVQIQVKSISVADPAINLDGGVAAVKFDVISNGTGVMAPAPLPQSSGGPNIRLVKTTFNNSVVPVSSFAAQLLPQLRDATPADNPIGPAGASLYMLDGDLDAMDGMLADTNLSYGSSQVGVSAFQTIATEVWSFTNPASVDALTLILSNGMYYDFSQSASPNFMVPYTNYSTATFSIAVPEPPALVSIVLAGLGFAVVARRQVN